MKNARNGIALALFLLILATAFTGMAQPAPTYHEDCIDGIPNPPNTSQGSEDIFSDGCAEYPYSDGNGEEPTPPEDRYSQAIDDYPSLFEYHMTYSPDPLTLEVVLCTALAFGFYATSADAQDASQYISDNMIDCSPYIP
jgi:hypothetical protein